MKSDNNIYNIIKLIKILMTTQKKLDVPQKKLMFDPEVLNNSHFYSEGKEAVMSGEFLGTFKNSVNKLKWITIPAAFKKKFNTQVKQTVVITLGPNGNIAIYPLDNWNEKIDKLKNGTDRDKQLLSNLRTFASSEQKIEQNGRIKIGTELLEIANIKDKVIIKGSGNYISVWSPQNYEQFRQKRLEEHKKLFNSMDYQ